MPHPPKPHNLGVPMSRLVLVVLWSMPFLWFVVESHVGSVVAGVR